MDYGLFRRYEKIAGDDAFPKALHQNGLFLLELRYSKDAPTRSIHVPMRLDLSAFGEITGITVENLSLYAGSDALESLRSALKGVEPLRVDYDPAEETLRIRLIDDVAHRQKNVQGSFVFNDRGELATVMARLR
jgi:hypothetical protein